MKHKNKYISKKVVCYFSKLFETQKTNKKVKYMSRLFYIQNYKLRITLNY